MCGIIGIIGKAPVTPLLVEALKRLEYRGYDSAGIATVHRGKLDRRRAVWPEHAHEFVRRNRTAVLADDRRSVLSQSSTGMKL